MEGTNLDALTIIISVIAIIISIISLSKEAKNNRTNLEAVYHEKIFSSFLLETIPNSRQRFSYLDGKVSNTESLEETLIDLRRKCVYFKYKDSRFYNSLTEVLFEIEDYIVTNAGEMSRKDYDVFKEAVDKKLEDLYQLINDKYVGR